MLDSGSGHKPSLKAGRVRGKQETCLGKRRGLEPSEAQTQRKTFSGHHTGLPQGPRRLPRQDNLSQTVDTCYLDIDVSA
jgi:hypothetical protein